jgi:acyl-coenzyme A thioesterase PaaI-like protein
MTTITQSGTHQCFVCGIDNPAGLKILFKSDGKGNVSAETIFSRNHQGYPGIVHGGVIAAVLDEAAGRATMKGKRPDLDLVTGMLSIRYRKPVRVGERIIIKGMMESVTGRVFKCKSDMRSVNGELLAEAEVVLVHPDKELIKNFEIGDDQWIDHADQE